jgi:hypothetical protein
MTPCFAWCLSAIAISLRRVFGIQAEVAMLERHVTGKDMIAFVPG